jgi:prepilin-type N-terminal cleavage/methylation domain-containing protein
MKGAKGFSLVELLCVIAILCLLAALTYPAFNQVRERAKVTSCGSNLRQIAMAMSQYASEYGGDGVYGDTYSMGLPPFPFTGLQQIRVFKCQAVPSEVIPSPKTFPYMGQFTEPDQDHSQPKWADYAIAFKDEAITWYDFNHNSIDVPIEAELATKLGLGVTLGGSLVTRRRTGFVWAKSWWHDDFEQRMKQ